MNLGKVYTTQFGAALAMMEQTIRSCPAELWEASKEGSQFWRIVYHGLFYTHLYLQESLATFQVWTKHRKGIESLGAAPLAAEGVSEQETAYTQAEMLEYVAFCRREAAERLQATDFAAPSGFDWLPFDKAELQVYNLRHLHQHIGELGEQLSQRGVKVHWVITEAL